MSTLGRQGEAATEGKVNVLDAGAMLEESPRPA
jgi:hypothetical protein